MKNEKFDILLINLVKRNSNIYDRFDTHFKNKALKDAAWTTISRIMKTTKSQCIQRWKGLRIRYTVEKRKVRSEGKLSTWNLYSTMAFLDRFVLPRPSRSSRTLTQNVHETSDMDQSIISDVGIENIEDIKNNSLINTQSVELVTKCRKNEKHLLNVEYAFAKTVDLMVKNIRGKKKRRKVQHEIMQILNSYNSHTDSH